MKYFADITTLDALKAEYRRLVLKHHPDGGETSNYARIGGDGISRAPTERKEI